MVFKFDIRNSDLLKDEKLHSGAVAAKDPSKQNVKISGKNSLRSGNGSQVLHNRAESPTKRSKSPTKRAPTPKRVSVKLSEKQKADAVKSTHNERCWEVLNRDDDYYHDLQNFRKLHPDLTSKRVSARFFKTKPRPTKFKSSLRREEQPIDEPDPEIIADDGIIPS